MRARSSERNRVHPGLLEGTTCLSHHVRLQHTRASAIYFICTTLHWRTKWTDLRLQSDMHADQGEGGPQPGNCERCGYICSQPVCKACVMLEGLNSGNTRLGVTRARKQPAVAAGTGIDAGRHDEAAAPVGGARGAGAAAANAAAVANNTTQAAHGGESGCDGDDARCCEEQRCQSNGCSSSEQLHAHADRMHMLQSNVARCQGSCAECQVSGQMHHKTVTHNARQCSCGAGAMIASLESLRLSEQSISGHVQGPAG